MIFKNAILFRNSNKKIILISLSSKKYYLLIVNIRIFRILIVFRLCSISRKIKRKQEEKKP